MLHQRGLDQTWLPSQEREDVSNQYLVEPNPSTGADQQSPTGTGEAQLC